MAAKDSTSRARRVRNKSAKKSPSEASSRGEAPQAPPVGIPSVLHFAIEEERSRLMSAEAILHCAVLALDSDDSPSTQGPHYQCVIDAARDMIVTAINQLDSVSLRAVLRHVKNEVEQGEDAEADLMLATRHEVKERVAAYVH